VSFSQKKTNKSLVCGGVKMNYLKNREEFKKRYNIKRSDVPYELFCRQLYKKVHKLDKCLSPKEIEFNFFHSDFDIFFDHVIYYRDIDGQMIVVTHPYTEIVRFTKLGKELEKFLISCGVGCKVDIYDKEYGFYGFNTLQGVITFKK
jgi:hypothetical protein